MYMHGQEFSPAHPEKFPTDANGNLIFVPGIMKVFDPTKGSLDTANVFYDPEEMFTSPICR